MDQKRDRKLAVDMYTGGSNLEAVGRVLGVKPGTVYSWVKKPSGLGFAESPGGAAGGTPPAGASPGHIL